MRLTTSGTVFAIGGLALVVAAYRFGVPAFLPAGLLLIALVVFSLAVGWALGARVSAGVRVTAPRAAGIHVVRAGSAVRVRTSLHNPLPVGTGAFTLVLHTAPGFGPTQRAHIAALPPRSHAAVDADFAPQTRGISGIERITTEFTGPFGLSIRRVRLVPAVPIAVAPLQLPVDFCMVPGRTADVERAQRFSRGVGSRDFETRPYVPGDDLRHVHWKSTARLGELMVRTEAEESSPHLDVLIDLGGFTPAGESLLAAVATCARNALRTGATVTLFTTAARSGPEALVTQRAATLQPGDEALLDVFLARLGSEEAGELSTPAGGFTLLATDAPDPQARAAALLRPGARRTIWSTAQLGDDAPEPHDLARVAGTALPWRMATGWSR